MATRPAQIEFDESNKFYNIWIAFIVMHDGTERIEPYAWPTHLKAMHHYSHWINSETWTADPGKGWTNDFGYVSGKNETFGPNAKSIRITNMLLIV